MKINRIAPISIVFVRSAVLLLSVVMGVYLLPGIYSLFTQGRWTAEAYAQEVGMLRVTINPQEAIDVGAQWRVDGGTWRDSGVSVGIVAGSHIVEFKGIDGWDAPADIPVTIVADAITEATGVYTVIRSLWVFITPAGAIDAGAQWNVDGGPWQDSGNRVSQLSVGDHTVNYKDLFGWSTPPSEAVTIVAGQITETTGTYTQLFGSLEVVITPQAVINEGAQWRVDEGHWQDSGTMISGVPAGEHTVVYKGVFGWTRPADQSVTVYGSQVNEATGDYAKITTGVTLYVPSEYTTIQAAINAASDGDTVLVADGTYVGLWNKDLEFNGKAIKVVSDNGPFNCIIDLEGLGQGFFFHTDERQDSVVSGLTIRRGWRGIFCHESSPTIFNCIIIGCSGYWHGGGVYNWKGYPIITNCIVAGNSAFGASGESGAGGGIYSEGGLVTIDKCIVAENKSCRGGGVFSVNGSITNCIMFGNESWDQYYPGNVAGVFCLNTKIVNCTISGNTPHGGTGTYYPAISADSATQITNSVIWNNSPNEVCGNPSITYSDIKGGYPGEGNIDTDPFFVDPDNDDYNLTSESPCIDTATPEGAPATDIEGTPRPQGAGFDMGAYEFIKSIVYISQDGICDEKTPCYSTIQEGIDWDGVIFTIKAQQGVYSENIVLDQLRKIFFQGGWDSEFTSASGTTGINSMIIRDGTMVLDEGCLSIGGD